MGSRVRPAGGALPGLAEQLDCLADDSIGRLVGGAAVGHTAGTVRPCLPSAPAAVPRPSAQSLETGHVRCGAAHDAAHNDEADS
jgi:hypothetical protein